MSVFSDFPFSNLTIYRKDYTKKPYAKAQRGDYPITEFANPIVGPVEEKILPRYKYEKLPKPQNEYPEPQEYADCIAENYPSTRIFLRDPPGGPIDMDVIDKMYQNENRSIYMVDYCLMGDYESRVKGRRGVIHLPDNYCIPLTTYRCSYRNPFSNSVRGLIPKTISRPKDKLVINEKERLALDLKTGETVYQADIGNTGQEIIEGKLHGDPNIRPTFDPVDVLKAGQIRGYLGVV